MNPVGVWFCWLNCGGGGDIILGLNEFLEVCWLDLGDNEEVAKGEVAILSKVDMLENMFRASGKFGGVAGVFAGVISYVKISLDYIGIYQLSNKQIYVSKWSRLWNFQL